MRTESAVQLLGIRYPFTNFRANVEAAYRRLAVKMHPDKGGCQEAFVLLHEAREICLGQEAPAEVPSWKDRSCAQLCADPRIRSVHEQINGGGCDDRRRLAAAEVEITKLRMEAFIANLQSQARFAREEAEARRQDELERQRREAERRQQHEEELRRRREAEMRRRREEETRRRREEETQAQDNARSDANFKPYMPRIWPPQLNAAQVRKKTAFLKRLRSLRTMRKRAQDAGGAVSAYNDKIEDIFREAWELHRAASTNTTA